MRFMIIVKATRDSEAGMMPEDALIAEMGRYHEELAKAGMLIDGSGLQPSSKGWRIRYSGNHRSFVDGPFAETKELVAGYTLIRAKSQNLEWTSASRSPAVDGGLVKSKATAVQLEDFAPAGDRASASWRHSSSAEGFLLAQAMQTLETSIEAGSLISRRTHVEVHPARHRS
jgi:hypothetical protein